MKKHVIKSDKEVFAADAVLGLTIAQHVPRKHAVDFLRGDKGLNIVKVTAPVSFDKGEEIFVTPTKGQ